MIDYIELMKNTALLKVAMQYITNESDEISSFKRELQEQIDKNEKDMEDFDKWVTMKEQEAINNVD
jgi:prefoldin subunit 5